MNNEEIDKKAKRKKNGCITISFSINDCPLWLYKWFLDDKNRYNDVYWVRLKEIHDMLMMQEGMREVMAETPQQALVKEVSSKEDKEKVKKSYLVKTFGGTEEVKIENDENVEEVK